jgi:hypothetical protein
MMMTSGQFAAFVIHDWAEIGRKVPRAIAGVALLRTGLARRDRGSGTRSRLVGPMERKTARVRMRLRLKLLAGCWLLG